MLSRFRYLFICVFFLIPTGLIQAQTSLVTGLPDFTNLIKTASPAVVKINTLSTQSTGNRSIDPSMPPFFRDFFEQYSQPQQRSFASVGSGFIISADGYIVTNHHVIDGADKIRVRLNDRREYEARVIGSDSRSDLALLKIDESNLPILAFAKSDTLEVGDWVLAIGSPFDLDYSASVGIVSAIGRSLPSGRGQDYVPFIQTDVAINPGNSGGPLFNLKGEVVGINSQIYTRSGGFMGLSFAVPVSVAEDVLAQLKDNGSVARGWLGVVIQDVDLALSQSFGLDKPKGALVTQVQRDGPADRAGIKAGDVIIEFDGETIEYSHDLPHAVGLIAPGSKSKAVLIRQKRQRSVTVEVGALEQSGQTRLARTETPKHLKKKLAISVEPVDRDTLRRLKLDLNVNGAVQVSSVDVDSFAARAGLSAGDLIVQIDFQDTGSVKEFEKVLSELEVGSVVPILFYRNDKAVFRTIQVDG